MEKYPVADAHCDFLYFAAKDGWDIGKQCADYQCMTLDRMKAGNVAIQFFAAWTDDKERRRTPLQQCLDMISAYYRMLDKHSDILVPFTPDFSPESGKIATVLAIENSSCMMDDLNNLEIFHHLGVRSMTLTWNYKNSLACPSTAKHDTGLTPLGRTVIKRLTELDIAIDLSHLSDKGIDEVLSLTDVPIFSSHTNARDLFYAPRSMKNAHIKEIASRGGVIGVNFYYKQLTQNETACVKDIANHICYIAELAGIDCVSIGSDFDGMNIYPRDLKHSGHIPRLTIELENRGFSRSDIEKIMYGNLKRFLGTLSF